MDTNYLKVFAAAAGVDAINNDYHQFKDFQRLREPIPKADESEVKRLVQEVKDEMSRLDKVLIEEWDNMR